MSNEPTVITCDWISKAVSLTLWVRASLATSVFLHVRKKKRKYTKGMIWQTTWLFILEMKPFCIFYSTTKVCGSSDQITKHFGPCLHLYLMLNTCDRIIWNQYRCEYTLGHCFLNVLSINLLCLADLIYLMKLSILQFKMYFIPLISNLKISETVFSVTRSFRNHSVLLICYYQCWKHWQIIIFFPLDFLIYIKFNRTALLWNRFFCNNVKVFTVTFDQCA